MLWNVLGMVVPQSSFRWDPKLGLNAFSDQNIGALTILKQLAQINFH